MLMMVVPSGLQYQWHMLRLYYYGSCFAFCFTAASTAAASGGRRCFAMTVGMVRVRFVEIFITARILRVLIVTPLCALLAPGLQSLSPLSLGFLLLGFPRLFGFLAFLFQGLGFLFESFQLKGLNVLGTVKEFFLGNHNPQWQGVNLDGIHKANLQGPCSFAGLSITVVLLDCHTVLLRLC